MIKITIIENETSSCDIIEETINSFCKGVEILSITNNIKAGVKKIISQPPNLVFINYGFIAEIFMETLNKFDSLNIKFVCLVNDIQNLVILKKDKNCKFIQKPIAPTELITIVFNTFIEFNYNKPEYGFHHIKHGFNYILDKSDKIVLRTSESIYPVNINEIIRCESGGAYTYFYLNNKKKITVSKALREYEGLLHRHNFLRVHQSHLININYIDRFDKKHGGVVHMKDGISVPVSFRKKEKLLKMFEDLSIL